jgi:DNA primase
MTLNKWLEEALAASKLSEEARYYLLGRGASPEIVDTWGFTCFEPPVEPCPDTSLSQFGPHWEVFEGKLICPLYSPRGKLLGFDSRTVHQKDLIRFLLPEANWTATWVGMPFAMKGIWENKPIYVVEGIFDVFALHHVVTDGVVLGSGPARLAHKHLEFFHRWATSTEVSMVYDQDDSGRRGTQLAIKNLRYLGVSCREIRYRGKDPGDIWDHGGSKAVREAFPHLCL